MGSGQGTFDFPTEYLAVIDMTDCAWRNSASIILGAVTKLLTNIDVRLVSSEGGCKSSVLGGIAT